MSRYLYPGALEELKEAQREKAEMDALTGVGLQSAGALYQE